MQIKDIDEAKITEMIRTAIDILPNSYAPYSDYNVAAAALMSSGKIYSGVNIESAALSCTICAERNAIFHALAQGERELLAVAVVGGQNASTAPDLEKGDYCTPCGVCRQVMRDFAKSLDMKIICAKSESDYKVWTLGEMLPASFGPESLA